MSDPSPDPVPTPPPPSGAVMQELQGLSQKLDLVAGAAATIAAGHNELLDHLSESIARQSHEAGEVAARLAAIERQVLAGPDAGDGGDGGSTALLDRLDAIERAVAALPGAAPGVESTFVALADRLEALADGERESRESVAALTAAVESLQLRHADADAELERRARDDGPDLRAELQALTEAQRAVAEELAALGPRVNELLDRHPDGLPVPPPPANEVVAPDDVSPPPSPGLELAPLEGRVADLAEVAASQAVDLSLALEVLSKLAEAIDRLDERSEDRLAAMRDASTTPIAELHALLLAGGERRDAQMQELSDRVASLVEAQAADADVVEPAEPGPAAVLARLDDLVTAMDEHVPDPAVLDSRLTQLSEAVAALSIERAIVPVASPAPAPVVAVEPLFEARLTHHIDTALAGMLRLFDDRLVALRATLTAAMPAAVATAPPPAANPNLGGFEAGAVMGAAQAAWSRLEQRLDSEFDDLSRQLQALGALVEQAVASTESLANRPVVTGDQVRRAAVSLRDTVVSANKQRRDRRGGPKGLGPGASGY